MSVFETAFFKGESGPFRDYLGKFSGRLLILGDGRTVWDDERDYRRTHQSFDVMGIKMAGAVYPGIRHWAHLHPEQWAIWEHVRRIRGGRARGALPPLKWAHGVGPDQNVIRIRMQHGGNSAAFAALVGVALGYDEIVLAGCPSDSRGHYYDPPGVENPYSGFESSAHERNWKHCRDNYFFGKVRSLSGNTKTWLS